MQISVCIKRVLWGCRNTHIQRECTYMCVCSAFVPGGERRLVWTAHKTFAQRERRAQKWRLICAPCAHLWLTSGVYVHTHGAIVYTKGWMGRDGERDRKRALEWLWLWSASRRWWNGLATRLTAAKCIIVNKIEYSLHRGNNNFSLKQEKKLYLFKENANKRYCSIFF